VLSRVRRRRRRQTLPAHLVFYAACAPLLAFYAFFAFLLHPAAGALHPHTLADTLAAQLPAGAAGLISLCAPSPPRLLPRGTAAAGPPWR
jgi:ATP/ADP translocase